MNIYFKLLFMPIFLLFMGMTTASIPPVGLPSLATNISAPSPKAPIRRVPNLTTQLEYSLDQLRHHCQPPFFKFLKNIIEKNRAFAIFSPAEIRMLLGNRFAKISVRNSIVLDAFREFIDPSTSPDAIHAWLSSDPLLGPNERRFLAIALLIFEREAAADLAIIRATYLRAEEEFNNSEPEALAAINDEFERLSRDWEFVTLLISRVIGFPDDFDRNTCLMASEVYRDRVGEIEIAMVSKNWPKIRDLLLTAVKNDLTMQENEVLIALAKKLKSMDTSALEKEDISFLKDMANQDLLRSREAISQQFIPRLMESDVGEQLEEATRRNLTTRLQGAYRGHYFRDADLKFLKEEFQEKETLLQTLAKPSFDEIDRARIRFHLLNLLNDARTLRIRQKLILLIFRLYSPPSLRPIRQQPLQ